MLGRQDITSDPFGRAFEAAFNGASKCFEEPVVVRVKKAGEATERRSTVRASLLFGSLLGSAAGANNNHMVGADVSVVIRRAEWPFADRPGFGDRVEIGEGREAQMATVQSVDTDGHSWTLACTFDERCGTE